MRYRDLGYTTCMTVDLATADTTASLVAITPTTYLTPEDYEEWCEACKEASDQG